MGTRTLTNFGLFPRDQSGHSDFDNLASFPEIRVGTRTLTNFGLFPRDQSGHSDFDKFWPLSQRSEWALGL